ncbi:hypothetical protein Tco_1468014 [Tanacetum coccineum]
MNIAAYTKRFNVLALLCPDAVPTEKKKVELYIKGLPEIIKGETTSSRPATLNEVVLRYEAWMGAALDIWMMDSVLSRLFDANVN